MGTELYDSDGKPYFPKDPDATLDYGFDLSDWLATGETVSSVVWTVPAGVTKDTGFPGFASGEFNDGTNILVAISGGTAAAEYDISAAFTTSAGRTDERTLRLKVAER